MPLVGVWRDGAFAFCTGADEQKQRNLDANPQVAVTTGSTGANGWDSGKDVVVEGTAVRVTDAESCRGWPTRGSPSTARTGSTRCAARSSSSSATPAAAGGRRLGLPRRPAKVLAFGDAHGQVAYRF